MAKEDKMVEETKETTVESNIETPTDKVEVETDVADSKPTDVETETDALDKEDVDELLTLLNEINTAVGSEGAIGAIPDEMRGVTQAIVDKIVFLRNLYEDPTFEDILDDLAEQAELGETPSILVAVARTIPMEDIEAAADEENYSEIQSKVKGRIAERAENAAEEGRVLSNIDQTMQNLEQYASEQNYSDEEKDALMAEIKKMMGWFADGSISVEEFAEIDKKRNYDRDIEEVKSQIPPETKREVMPDAASMAAMPQAPAPKKAKPSVIDNVAQINEPSYLQKRKR